MESIAAIFDNNPKVALVAIISLRDRSVLLKESRLPTAGPLPPSAVVDTYLNIITTAALAFDIESTVQNTNNTNTNAYNHNSSPQRFGGGPQVDEAIQEEAWGLLRFRTRQWEIAAFRQDNADVAFNDNANDANGGNGKGGSSNADQWMMVTFSEPNDNLGTNAGNMTSRVMAGTRR